MAVILFVAGSLFIVAAITNNVSNLLGQLEKDLIGPNGFFVWGGLLLAIYVIGKITGLDKTAQGFIWLLIMVFVLKNPNSVTSIPSQISNAQASATVSPVSQGQATDVNPATGASPTLSATAGSTPSGTASQAQIGSIATQAQSALPIFAQIGTGLGF